MVEGEARHLVEGKPLCFGGIIATLYFRFLRQGIERDGDDTGARVTVDIGECPDLLYVTQIQARFFFQLA